MPLQAFERFAFVPRAFERVPRLEVELQPFEREFVFVRPLVEREFVRVEFVFVEFVFVELRFVRVEELEPRVEELERLPLVEEFERESRVVRLEEFVRVDFDVVFFDARWKPFQSRSRPGNAPRIVRNACTVVTEFVWSFQSVVRVVAKALLNFWI